MEGQLISKAERFAKVEPAKPTLEGIPFDIYETIIKFAVSATTDSTHTITIACANCNTTRLIADVELLQKVLSINHRSRKTLTGLILHNFSNSKTQIKSVAVVDDLVKGRLFSAFHQEFHNLDVEIHLLKRLEYRSSLGYMEAGSLVSLCYPNIKSIITTLSYKDDACFHNRPNNITCTDAEKRAYVGRMVNRMTEGVRLFVCSFIYGCTEYERVIKLECSYEEEGQSTVMFMGRFESTRLVVEQVNWGSRELWEDVLLEKLVGPYQTIDED